MKNQTRNLLLLSISCLLLITASSAAGTGDAVGNGGDVVLCPGLPIRMLDTVEAQHDHLQMDTGGADLTLGEKVKLITDRMVRKDRYLGLDLQKRANVLLADLIAFEENGSELQANMMIRDGELPNVADEGATFIPPGCALEQLIIRTANPLPNQRQYAVRKDLWMLMSKDEQAIAISHEAIYGYLVDRGSPVSPAARWLNGLLMSDSISSISDNELFALMEKFYFGRSDWERESFGYIYNPLRDVEYASDGSIKLIKWAKISPEFQKRLIATLDFKPDRVTNVLLEHGKTIAYTLFSANFNFNIRTMQRADWKQWTDGAKIMAKKPGKAGDFFGLEDVRVHFEDDGIALTHVRQYHWKINPTMFAPIFNFFMMQVPFNQRQVYGTIKLSPQGEVISTNFPKVNFRNMGR